MKVKSFVREFIAVVTGDDNAAKGEKVFRQADSGLKVQISSLEGDTVNLEDKVSDAEESQKLARVNNGQNITDRASYVEGLITAENNVKTTKKNLEKHLEKIAFLKSEKAKLEEEVEETTKA